MLVLTAAGQAALTAIGNGAVLSLGGDPNYAGSVMIDGLPNREATLAWEKAQVRLIELLIMERDLLNSTDLKVRVKL